MQYTEYTKSSIYIYIYILIYFERYIEISIPIEEYIKHICKLLRLEINKLIIAS